jgi:hypothetical protein
MPRQHSVSGLTGRVRRYAAGTAVAGAAAVAAIASTVSIYPTSAAAAPARTVRHANLLQSIQTLPDYFPGVVHWHLSTSTKHYGTTDWDTSTITISAFTPLTLLYSVVAHEWSHEIQAYDYRGDLWAGVKAMDRSFGGGGKSGQRGIEYAADCMAILQGATWTDYTPCHSKVWRRDAHRLLAGHKLKKAKHPSNVGTSPGAVTYGTKLRAAGVGSCLVHRGQRRGMNRRVAQQLAPSRRVEGACCRRGQEVPDDGCEPVGLVVVREVPGVGEDLELAAGECAMGGIRVPDRDDPVLLAPHDQGRETGSEVAAVEHRDDLAAAVDSGAQRPQERTACSAR